jgi:hypothetical protein
MGPVHLAYNPSYSACFFQPEQYFSLTKNQPTVFFSRLIIPAELLHGNKDIPNTTVRIRKEGMLLFVALLSSSVLPPGAKRCLRLEIRGVALLSVDQRRCQMCAVCSVLAVCRPARELASSPPQAHQTYADRRSRSSQSNGKTTNGTNHASYHVCRQVRGNSSTTMIGFICLYIYIYIYRVIFFPSQQLNSASLDVNERLWLNPCCIHLYIVCGCFPYSPFSTATMNPFKYFRTYSLVLLLNDERRHRDRQPAWFHTALVRTWQRVLRGVKGA